MRDCIHFVDTKRCKDMTEFYKGRGCASIIIEDNKMTVSCRELVEKDLPLSRLRESIDVLNQFGYTICKSKDILSKYLSK